MRQWIVFIQSTKETTDLCSIRAANHIEAMDKARVVIRKYTREIAFGEERNAGAMLDKEEARSYWRSKRDRGLGIDRCFGVRPVDVAQPSSERRDEILAEEDKKKEEQAREELSDEQRRFALKILKRLMLEDKIRGKRKDIN